MQTTYKEYYEYCRGKYLEENPNSPTPVVNLYKMGMLMDVDIFEFNENYLSVIHNLRKTTQSKIDNDDGIILDTHLAIKLNNIWDVPEIYNLANFFGQELQKKVYGCYCYAEHVHWYRNTPTRNSPESSWLWHYDGCADEQIKVMVYLNHVEKHTGAIEFISSPVKRVESPKIGPRKELPPVFPRSRIPHHIIDQWIDEGHSVHTVTGAPGTCILFSPNCVHRATVPSSSTDIHIPPRDCIIFTFRPFPSAKVTLDSGHSYSWTCPFSVKGFQF